MQVSALIVSWNVQALLRQCLTSLLVDGSCAEIIVVDNCSADGTPEMVRKEFPAVRLLVSAENRGFGAALNAGLRLAAGDAILVLNADTAVYPGAVSKLAEVLERDAGCGAAAPMLVSADGNRQSSRRRFPSFRDLLIESTPLQSWPGAEHCLRHFYCSDTSPKHVQTVDWAYGAAFLLRRQTLAEIGALDDRFFMYSEEVDLFRRLTQSGWRTVYTPEAKIIHHEGKSSDQVPVKRLIYFNSSKVLYTQKHFGPVMSEYLRHWLLGCFVEQSAIEAVKWGLRHKQDLRQTRIHAYKQVMKTGLKAQ